MPTSEPLAAMPIPPQRLTTGHLIHRASRRLRCLMVLMLLCMAAAPALATEIEDEEDTLTSETAESVDSTDSTDATENADTTESVEADKAVETPDGVKPPAPATPPAAPTTQSSNAATSSDPTLPPPEQPAPAHPPAAATPLSESDAPATTPDFTLLEKSVAPGHSRTLFWTPSSALDSLETPVPVLVVHGKNPGPVLCLTAAVHGDELNGIEIVRQIIQNLEADDLNGTVIGVPIVNLDGFRRASRYVSDRRDLNRHFPGSRSGSLASRIAHSFFHSIVTSCRYLVDVHTGSFHRTNLPQLRANLKMPEILEFTKGFGGIVVVQEKGEFGTLRRAAQDRGIISVTLETGGPLHLEKDAVDWGVKGIENLLHSLEMQDTLRLWTTPQPVYYKTRWVRAQQGGLLFSTVELNDVVKKGQLMGRVTDPITNTSSDITAPYNGRVVGMAFDQVVSPGFAAYHLGVEAPAKELSAQPSAAPFVSTDDAQPLIEDNIPDESLDTHDPLTD